VKHGRWLVGAALSLLWTVTLGVGMSWAAQAEVGLVDTGSGLWRVRSGSGSNSFFFGNPGDFAIMGDWDCDGIATPGVRRQHNGMVYLRNSNTQGMADTSFFYGNPGDVLLAGDFDGNGCDTLAVYRPTEGRVYIKNSLGSGSADFTYYFGNPGDRPFVGDFDGDGIDEIGLRRESTGFAYLRLTHTTGVADVEFFYGNPGDHILAGDWDGDGIDTVGIYRPSEGAFHLRNSNSQGVAATSFHFGPGPSPGLRPVAGPVVAVLGARIEPVELGLEKTVSNATRSPGQGVSFTVRVTNQGPGRANAVAVTDALPVGLSNTSVQASQGSYDPGSGRWSVGSIGRAGSATLTMTATVADGVPGSTVTNLARITTSSPSDPDPTDNSSSASFTLLNQTPVAADDSAVTAAGSAVEIDVLANDLDPDGALDPSTLVVTSGPSHGSASPASGRITYQPAPGFTGSDSFTYTVADGHGSTSNQATVTVTVSSANQAPVVEAIPDQSSTEGEAVSLQAEASDPDGDSLSFSAAGLPSGLTIDGASGAITGVIGLNAAGTHTVEVTATDDGEPTGAASVSFTWTVAAAPPPLARPSVTGVEPADGATGVPRDAFVAATVDLPNAGYGIDAATLTSDSVKLYPTAGGQPVPSNLNTSGGGDAIVLQPIEILAANTAYTFEVTEGLKDLAGSSFVPFTSTFTTGLTGVPDPPETIQFEQIFGVASGEMFTSVTMGPDGKLYAGTLDGKIVRYTVSADGTLSSAQTITSLQVANGDARMLIGLRFDPSSTASDLVLWVTHGAWAFTNAPDWSGKLTRMSGPELGTVQDYVVGLPRSIRDHMTNSIDFKPGDNGVLYLLQGSNTAMGAADSVWGNRPERLLNAALLRVDLAKITVPPLNVKTQDGGSYDPSAPGAPVTIYATGLRNAYDLVWHSNGQLYVPTNGSAAGGNTPGTPSPLPASCQPRIDGAYTGPSVPALENVAQTQPDFIFRVEEGGYYGHPNPQRCEWVMNGGNPSAASDPGQVDGYPVGTQPDRNWRGFAFDFENNKSPNGVVEYQGEGFGGALQHSLLVVRYSAGDDIIVLTPGDSGDIVESQTDLAGLTGFVDPLDLVENPANGHLYVTELGAGRITLLRPLAGAAPPGEGEIEIENLDATGAVGQGFFHDWLVFSRVNSGTSSHKFHDVATLRIKNVGGTEDLVISGLGLSDPSEFTLPDGEDTRLPLTIPPGDSYDLEVKFIESSGAKGVRRQTLSISSNDADEPTTVVQLAGVFANLPEGGNEVGLTGVVQAFGHTTTLGEPLSDKATSPLAGDEVRSDFWTRADPGKPVYVRQLAAFHSCCSDQDLIQITGTGGGSFSHEAVYGQSVLPLKSNSTTPAEMTISPSSSQFEIKIAGYSTNLANPLNNGNLGIRIWALKDRTGTLVPDAYLVAQDFVQGGCGSGDANCDYNDNVYLITNIEPVDPLPPTGVQAASGEEQVDLSWSPSAEPDLAGYNVYRSTTPPVSIGGTPLNSSALITTTSYTDPGLSNGTTYYYVVTAVDETGHESAASTEVSATPQEPPPEGTLKVNFQSETASVPTGYLRDFGEAFGPRSGADQGSGLTYGWVAQSDLATPLSLVGNGRDRGKVSDQRLDTLMHMQLPAGSTGVTTPGAWETQVANGTYTVTVSAGDSDATVLNSTHQVNVEGETAISCVTPTAAQPFAAGTVVVDVTDGTLTIDAIGGTNTKLNYVDILPGDLGGETVPASSICYQPIADQPFGVSEGQGEVVGGKLYTFGGFDSTKACCTPTKRAYVYDPAANTWTAIADLPHTNGGGVTHAGVTNDGSAIYLAGGYISNAGNTNQIFGTKEVWRYDVSSNTYTPLPSLPVERAAGQLEYLDGKLHYFGGTNLARTEDTDEHFVLDLAGGATVWIEAAPLPNPRNHLGSAVLNGKVYAVGGQHGHDSALTTQSAVHAYDPGTDTWNEVAALPSGRGHIAGGTFVLEGRILVAGGETAHGSSIAEVVSYDPSTNQWSQLTPLPQARASGVGGPVSGGFLYTSGGGQKSGWRGLLQ
jgi:uncharacterized repeat protein (TIGR01451 family)